MAIICVPVEKVCIPGHLGNAKGHADECSTGAKVGQRVQFELFEISARRVPKNGVGEVY